MAGGNKDTRIVELQFKNREFERNIAKSTKSIEELKEAMDFDETSKGLDDFARSMGGLDFSKFGDNLQRLTDKFTGLGDAGEYVISRIRNALESAARSVEHFLASLSVQQIPIGEEKYNQLNKSVMTIVSGGKATEEQAYATMERVMEYTRQTSHNFNTMVGQISNLTSIGMGLNEAERLIEAMGNAATFAGGDAQQAAMSMSVLSKAFSMNFLGYEQFLQLNNTSKVITETWRKQALEAAEAVGTLKRKNDKLYTNVKGYKSIEVTTKNLENTLKARWLTGEVLAKIYENYQFGDTLDQLRHPDEAVDSFGKTAYLTGQRALSLVDALNAMKESVSSGWMTTFRILWGDVSEAAEHFTNIADRVIDVLEKIQEFRNGILNSWVAGGGRTSLMHIFLGNYEEDTEEDVVGFMDLLEGLGKVVYDGFVDFMMLFGDPVDRMNMKKNPQYFRAWLGAQLAQITKGVEDFNKRISDFFNEEIDVGGKSKTRLEVIHEIIMGIAGILKFGYDILSGVVYFVSLIAGQLSPSFDSIITFLGKLGAEIYGTEQQAGDAGTIKKFFEDLAVTLTPVTDGINKLVESTTKLLTVLFGLDDQANGTEKKGLKIGDLLLTIADIIAKVLGPALEFFASVIDLISQLISGQIDFKEFGKQMGEAFKDMLRSFVDNLPDSMKGVGDWIRDLFGLWEDDTQANEKSFATFLHKLFTGSFSNFGEFLGGLFNGFSLKDAMENGFGFLSAFNFLNTVTGWFKGTNLYGVILAFLGVATVASIFRLIHQAGRAVKTIGGFFEDVGGNLIAGASGRYQWFSEKLLDIAKSVLMFAAAVAVFGSMDRTSLLVGIGALAAVLAMVVGLWILLEKSSVATSGLAQQIMVETIIVTMAGAIAAIALSISVLSLALIPLASDPKKMITAVLGLAAILTAFGVFFNIMLDKLDTFTFASGGTNQWAGLGKMAAMLLVLTASIAVLSAAIGALTVAMTPLALTGWGGTIRAIIAFTSIMAVFGVFIVLMLRQLDELAFTIGGGNSWSGIGKMAAMLLTLAATVGLMAVSIGALVVAITPLALMSWEGFVRAIGGLAIIMVELGLMIKAIQNMSIGDKSVSLKIAGLAGFATSLGILVFALTPLSMMSWKGWGQAMIGLGIVLAELAGMIFLVQKMGTGDKTLTLKIAGLAGFAASIGVLIFALIPLSMMSLPGIAQAVIGLGVVLLELIGFMKLAQVAKVDGIALGGFIGFALSIAILLFALKPLSEMSPEGYQRALIGLATVMLEVVVLMAIMKELRPDLKTAGSTLILLIGLGASMILFGIAMNEVKDIPWERMLGFAAAISLLLVAFAGAAALAKVGGIGGMLILVAGIGLLLAAISLLAPMVAGSLASSLKMMAGSLNYMTSMLDSFSNTMNQMDEDSADKGTRIIDKLKTMFERLVGFGSYTSAISAFSTALFDLSTGLQIFQNHTSKILDPVENKGLQLISSLAAAAPNIETLANANIDNLTAKLTGLGGAMMLYAEGAKQASTDGIKSGDTSDVEAAVAILRAISDSLVQDGAFIIPNDMPDEEKIGLFGAQLAALAAAMVKFEEAGKGLGTGTAEAIRCLTFFKDLKKEIVKADFWSDLGSAIRVFATGDNTVTPDEMAEFGKNIEQLGLALSSFAESTTTVDKTTGEIVPVNYDVAIKALESFETLDQKLSKIKFGGVASWFAGNPQTLVDFGGEIQTLGDNLNSFSASIMGDAEHPGFDQTAATVAIEATSSMVDFMQQMNEKLPKVGGLVTIWNTLWGGRSFDITDLKTQMIALGDGLQSLGKLNTGDWKNSTGVQNAIGTMDSIFALMTRIQAFYKQMDEAGIEGWSAYGAFGKLSEFVEMFANDENNVITNLSEFMRFLDTEISTWEAYNEDDFNQVLTRMEAFRNFAEGFSALTSTINDDRKAGTSWGFIGTKMTTDVAQSILNGVESTLDAVVSLITGMYNQAQSVDGVDWNLLGKNAVDGIALGIDQEGPVTLWPSVKAMMLKAYEEGKAAIDSNSPSKLFMQLGAFMGEGTAIGIQKSTGLVGQSADTMGEVALDSATDMIGLVSRIMAENTDASPTIAPVLDMTNVNAGLADFRSSLGGYGVGLDTSLSAIIASRMGTSGYADESAMHPDYSGIYQHMSILGEQIQQMGESIKRMKIVLDSGIVAGGVTDDVDLNLGRRMFYAGRNN